MVKRPQMARSGDAAQRRTRCPKLAKERARPEWRASQRKERPGPGGEGGSTAGGRLGRGLEPAGGAMARPNDHPPPHRHRGASDGEAGAGAGALPRRRGPQSGGGTGRAPRVGGVSLCVSLCISLGVSLCVSLCISLGVAAPSTRPCPEATLSRTASPPLRGSSIRSR